MFSVWDLSLFRESELKRLHPSERRRSLSKLLINLVVCTSVTVWNRNWARHLFLPLSLSICHTMCGLGSVSSCLASHWPCMADIFQWVEDRTNFLHLHCLQGPALDHNDSWIFWANIFWFLAAMITQFCSLGDGSLSHSEPFPPIRHQPALECLAVLLQQHTMPLTFLLVKSGDKNNTESYVSCWAENVLTYPNLRLQSQNIGSMML